MDEENLAGLVASALQRKRALDRANIVSNNMGSYDKWLAEAVELLLQIELMRVGMKDAR